MRISEIFFSIFFSEVNPKASIKKCIFNELKSQNSHARDIKNLVKTLVQVPLSHYIVQNRNIEKVEIKVINKIITCV